MNMLGFIQQVKNKVHLRLWQHWATGGFMWSQGLYAVCLFLVVMTFQKRNVLNINWITNSFGHVPWHRFQGPLNVGLDSLLSAAGVISCEGRTRSQGSAGHVWVSLKLRTFIEMSILSNIVLYFKKRLYRVWNSNCCLPCTLVTATAVPVGLWVVDQSIHQSALSIKHFKNNAAYRTNETQQLAQKRPLLALRTTN